MCLCQYWLWCLCVNTNCSVFQSLLVVMSLCQYWFGCVIDTVHNVFIWVLILMSLSQYWHLMQYLAVICSLQEKFWVWFHTSLLHRQRRMLRVTTSKMFIILVALLWRHSPKLLRRYPVIKPVLWWYALVVNICECCAWCFLIEDSSLLGRANVLLVK